MDDERYNAIQAKLTYQAGHAIVWRDAICNFFYRESGIPDARGRVGHYPDRTEAESMQLTGYQVINVDPWEDASGEKAFSCPSSEKSCSAQFTYGGPAGWND